MAIKTDLRVFDKRIRSAKKVFNSLIESEAKKAGDKILNNSWRRFSSHFSGSKFNDVQNAIKSAGVDVKRSEDGDVTLFVANMDILDRESELDPAISTGGVYHFWRILHEGSGMLATANNPHIFLSNKRSDKYPILAIVQTTALEPLFSPGRQAPVAELLALEGQGVIIIRHAGYEGHAWFLRNLDLFDEDVTEINRAVDRAIKESIKRTKNIK